MICFSILEPIVLIVRTLIQVARQIVRTVCEWVSSTITVIKEVTDERRRRARDHPNALAKVADGFVDQGYREAGGAGLTSCARRRDSEDAAHSRYRRFLDPHRA